MQNFEPAIAIDGINFYRIPGYRNYAVSRCGSVCALRSRQLLKQSLNRGGYPFVNLYNRGHNTLLVHRLMAVTFLGAQPGEPVDHIDRNRSNNALENLRIATWSGNNQNRAKTAGRSSKHKGVYVHAPSGRFRARIRDGHRMRHLGYFDCEDAAGRAYDEAAKQMFGEFACLNFTN